MANDSQATTVPTYGERLAILRKFYDGWRAGDGYDGRRLSPQQKAAITRKYNAHRTFEEKVFTSPGVRWVPTRVRTDAAVAAVRSLGPGDEVGYPKGLRRWVVVAVPGEAQRVGVTRSGKPEVWVAGGTRLVFERFDPVDMATDPIGVAREMTRLHPKANGYAVRVGEYGWAGRNVPLAFGPEFIEGAVAKMLYRYGADVEGESGRRAALYNESPSEHDYRDFVTGMVAFYLPQPGPEVFAEYVSLVKEVRKARRARRRSRREAMKGRQG